MTRFWPSFRSVSILCVCVLIVAISFSVKMLDSNAGKLQLRQASPVFEANDPKPTQAGDKGTLQPPSFKHDFGVVKKGAYRHEFLYKNNEAATLHIKGLTVSCTCVKLIQSPEKILPGETGAFLLEFGVENFGPVSQELRVTFDSGASVTMRLAAFRSGFALEPKGLHLGTIFFGSVGAGTASVLVGGISEAAIVDVETTDKRLVATLENADAYSIPTTNSVSRLGVLKITMDHRDPDRLGKFEGTITVKTNSTEQPIVTLPVNAMCVGRFEVTPEAVLLGTVRPGDSVERTVTLKPAPESQVSVSEAVELTSDHGEVNGELLREPNGIVKVLVRCQVKSDSKRGSIQGSLIGRSRDDALFRIPYTGFVLEDK